MGPLFGSFQRSVPPAAPPLPMPEVEFQRDFVTPDSSCRHRRLRSRGRSGRPRGGRAGPRPRRFFSSELSFVVFTGKLALQGNSRRAKKVRRFFSFAGISTREGVEPAASEPLGDASSKMDGPRAACLRNPRALGTLLEPWTGFQRDERASADGGPPRAAQGLPRLPQDQAPGGRRRPRPPRPAPAAERHPGPPVFRRQAP